MDFMGRFNHEKIKRLLTIYVSYTQDMERTQNDAEKKSSRERYQKEFLSFFEEALKSLKNDKKAFERLDSVVKRIEMC
jgi:hypothetical protein